MAARIDLVLLVALCCATTIMIGAPSDAADRSTASRHRRSTALRPDGRSAGSSLFERDTSIAVVGERASIKCLTTSPYVSFFVEDADGGWTRLATGDIVMPRYRRRIRVQRRKRSDFDYSWDVTIYRVNAASAGRYQCVEHPRDDIFQESARVARSGTHRLVVIASLPRCAATTTAVGASSMRTMLAVYEMNDDRFGTYNSSSSGGDDDRVVTVSCSYDRGLNARSSVEHKWRVVNETMNVWFLRQPASPLRPDDQPPPLGEERGGGRREEEATTTMRDAWTATATVSLLLRERVPSAHTILQLHLLPANGSLSETRMVYELPLDIVRAVRIINRPSGLSGKADQASAQSIDGATLVCERADGIAMESRWSNSLHFRWLDADTGARINDGRVTRLTASGGHRICVVTNALSEARASAVVDRPSGLSGEADRPAGLSGEADRSTVSLGVVGAATTPAIGNDTSTDTLAQLANGSDNDTSNDTLEQLANGGNNDTSNDTLARLIVADAVLYVDDDDTEETTTTLDDAGAREDIRVAIDADYEGSSFNGDAAGEEETDGEEEYQVSNNFTSGGAANGTDDGMEKTTAISSPTTASIDRDTAPSGKADPAPTAIGAARTTKPISFEGTARASSTTIRSHTTRAPDVRRTTTWDEWLLAAAAINNCVLLVPIGCIMRRRVRAKERRAREMILATLSSPPPSSSPSRWLRWEPYILAAIASFNFILSTLTFFCFVFARHNRPSGLSGEANRHQTADDRSYRDNTLWETWLAAALTSVNCIVLALVCLHLLISSSSSAQRSRRRLISNAVAPSGPDGGSEVVMLVDMPTRGGNDNDAGGGDGAASMALVRSAPPTTSVV
jgi:hypothetical protein